MKLNKAIFQRLHFTMSVIASAMANIKQVDAGPALKKEEKLDKTNCRLVSISRFTGFVNEPKCSKCQCGIRKRLRMQSTFLYRIKI